MKKDFIVFIDLNILVKAENEEEAQKIIRERFETDTVIREEPIEAVNIQMVKAEEQV